MQVRRKRKRQDKKREKRKKENKKRREEIGEKCLNNDRNEMKRVQEKTFREMQFIS